MDELFSSAYSGASPYEEVWFGEVVLDAERALWLRYATLDGQLRQASAWALWFDRSGVTARRETMALDEVQRQDGTVFAVPKRKLRLSTGIATGNAKEISWDLNWTIAEPGHRHVPTTVRRLGLAGRTYASAALRWSVFGQVQVGGVIHTLDGLSGVLGHIYGKANRTDGWVWAHCCNFEGEEDAVFEGVSARLLLGRFRTPTLTSMVLVFRGVRYAISATRTLVAVRSHWGQDYWTFSARQNGVHIEGEASFIHPDRLARVRYDKADGDSIWCTNSPHSKLRLRVVDKGRRIDVTLHSRRSCFEFAQRTPPAEPICLG